MGYRVLRLKRDIDYGVKGAGFSKGECFVQIPNDTTRLGALAVPVRRLSEWDMPIPEDPRAVFLPLALIETVGEVDDYAGLVALGIL